MKVAVAYQVGQPLVLEDLPVPAVGPRDVLVPESGVTTAREVLLQAELITPGAPRPVVSPGRLLAGLLGALLVGAAVVWGISQLVG